MEEPRFADPEVATFWRYIASSIDRLVALVEAIAADGLAWCPPAPGANSIHALAIHTMGNAEENILQTLCGVPVGRERDAEFAQDGSAAGVRARWRELRPRLVAALSHVAPGELARDRPHPRRGALDGRAVLDRGGAARRRASRAGGTHARPLARDENRLNEDLAASGHPTVSGKPSVCGCCKRWRMRSHRCASSAWSPAPMLSGAWSAPGVPTTGRYGPSLLHRGALCAARLVAATRRRSSSGVRRLRRPTERR